MKCTLLLSIVALFLISATFADDVVDVVPVPVPAVVPTTEEVPCVDGASKKDNENCNTCYCTQGQWACTRMQCNGPRLTIKNRRELETPCEDGKTKLDDEQCNTCSCHQGAWACTEKLCLPRKPDNLNK